VLVRESKERNGRCAETSVLAVLMLEFSERNMQFMRTLCVLMYRVKRTLLNKAE